MKKLLILLIFMIIPTMACTLSRVTPVPPVTQQKTMTPSPESTCTPSATVTQQVEIILVVDVGLHIRKDPNENGEDLGVIPAGSTIILLHNELENGWICVKWGDIEGYVNADYIQLPLEFQYK